jgi:2-oxoglutarate dehydrogenase E1 component
VDELAKGAFQPLIPDPFAHADGEKVGKVLFCSGKIYYDLLERQQRDQRKDVAIVRLEQLYPLPLGEIEAILDRYPNAIRSWVQEEPANMGAWTYLLARYPDMEWDPITRKSSASPATGYIKVHNQEQEALVDQAFA